MLDELRFALEYRWQGSVPRLAGLALLLVVGAMLVAAARRRGRRAPLFVYLLACAVAAAYAAWPSAQQAPAGPPVLWAGGGVVFLTAIFLTDELRRPPSELSFRAEAAREMALGAGAAIVGGIALFVAAVVLGFIGMLFFMGP